MSKTATEFWKEQLRAEAAKVRQMPDGPEKEQKQGQLLGQFVLACGGTILTDEQAKAIYGVTPDELWERAEQAEKGEN